MTEVGKLSSQRYNDGDGSSRVGQFEKTNDRELTEANLQSWMVTVR